MTARKSSDFEIAIICALPREADAVDALFDERYRRERNIVTGRIGQFNIVRVVLAGMGKVEAASACANLVSHYENLKLALVVGICGGVPSVAGKDIFLGDVILSDGVVQYDFGKQYPDRFERKSGFQDVLGRPGREIRNLLAELQTRSSREELEEKVFQNLEYLQSKLSEDSRYPGADNDKLFESSYRHMHHRQDQGSSCICTNCQSKNDPVCEITKKKTCEDLGCDSSMVRRRRTGQGSPRPLVHIGTIASADTVMKSGEDRDNNYRDANVIAFEMESAGVWDSLQFVVVIKGVCDYADSHKNDKWQHYAAATAVSCAKAFLEEWDPTAQERQEVQHLVGESAVDDPGIQSRTSNSRFFGEDKDLIHIYDSLAFPQMDERSSRIERAHARTFDWILPSADGDPVSPEYKPSPFAKWLENDDPIFWISGKAASGKSTLMKHIWQKLQLVNTLSRVYADGSQNLIVASMFFFDQGISALQMSYEGLLRTLLYRVLKDQKRLWREVFNVQCQKPKSSLFAVDITWTLDDLQSAFRTFASKKPTTVKVFLLIDGLDEFQRTDHNSGIYFGDDDDEDDQDTAEARRNIVARRAAYGEIKDFILDLSKYSGFKLCVSSRPLQVFEDAFSNFPGFKLQELTLQDIHQYVDDRLRNHQRMALLLEAEPTRTTALIHEISSRANGVFLWVRLVVDIILDALEAGDRIEQFEHKLDEVPRELRGRHGLFARMLANVLPEYREEGHAMFRVVLAAKSHLTELVLSFSQESPSSAISYSIGRISESDARVKSDEMHRRLKSRCGSLLESGVNPFEAKLSKPAKRDQDEIMCQISPNFKPHMSIEPIVSFVHRTAAEYLQRHTRNIWESPQTQHSADRQLIVSCLLQVKLIGRTAHVWEFLDAMRDAHFYAKRIQEQGGPSPSDLLDEIERAAKSIWSQGMSAGRPQDYNEDPGFGSVVQEARRHHGLPEGSVHPIVTEWGPQYPDGREWGKNWKSRVINALTGWLGEVRRWFERLHRLDAAIEGGVGAREAVVNLLQSSVPYDWFLTSDLFGLG